MEFTDFIIKIRSLKNGTQHFEYKLERPFFAEFGNSEILDASLDVDVEIEKGSGWMRVNFLVCGSVVTECDRCLEDLEIPLNIKSSLAVKFARTGEMEDEGSDEMVIVDPSDGELDLKQYIYDYVCINLPLQRVHKEGECNAKVMELLQGISPERENDEGEEKNATLEALLEKYSAGKAKNR